MRNAILALILALAATACHDDAIDSDEEARRAYLGLDASIEKALNLGFDGYNASSNANIDPQAGVGDADGTLTITGQADHGTSPNKQMRLYIGMVGYTDGEITVTTDDGDVDVDLTYDTSEVQLEQPYLHLSLTGVVDTAFVSSFTGDLTGTYQLSGDIDGEVTLTLTLAGEIQGDGTGFLERVPGSTTVLGTATSGDGLFDVDVTL
jgi:hypothetical protein